jgi:hypothetical protein
MTFDPDSAAAHAPPEPGVALVLDPEFGYRMIPLADLMPVWIVDTPTNREAAERARASRPPRAVTTFLAPSEESRESWFIDILFVLTEHVGAFAEDSHYDSLFVVGLEPSDRVRAELALFGLDVTELIQNGFLARRSPAPPEPADGRRAGQRSSPGRGSARLDPPV